MDARGGTETLGRWMAVVVVAVVVVKLRDWVGDGGS